MPFRTEGRWTCKAWVLPTAEQHRAPPHRYRTALRSHERDGHHPAALLSQTPRHSRGGGVTSRCASEVGRRAVHEASTKRRSAARGASARSRRLTAPECRKAPRTGPRLSASQLGSRATPTARIMGSNPCRGLAQIYAMRDRRSQTGGGPSPTKLHSFSIFEALEAPLHPGTR